VREEQAKVPARGVPRREFLRQGALTGGGMTGLALLPSLARRSYDGPVPVPPTARSVEAGLSGFVARWAAAGPVLALTRFAPFICDKVFNCRVADQARSYVLRLGTAGGAVSPGADPYRHADVVMPEHDWLGLLYGDYTGLSPFVAGDLFPSRDQSNKVVLLGIVMYVFAFLPAGKDPDPQLFLRILEGVVQRGGLPACAGEPSVTEELDRFNSDPRGYVVQTVAPGAAVPPVTRLLAEFVAGLRYEQLPAGAVASAKAQLKGILGSIWAGGRMPPGRKFAGAVKAFGDRPEATVIGANSFRSSARHAALVNSVYAQILEWEDWTFLAHSGASIVPAALASGELAGASGKQLLTAIVAGNEILARSGEVLTDVIHTGNAVPTHQLETPLVAGKMLGLDGPSLQDALGIACTQPQVTAIPAWTSEAKGLLSGWPVLTGVEAALYARAGISGRRDIVESPGGYCYRVSDIPSPERMAQLVDGLGSVWRFDSRRHELVIKRFPTDGFQLTSVQAILQIVNETAKHVFDATPRRRLPQLISRIQVRIPLVMAASATMFSKGGREIYERIRREPDWTYIALLFDGQYPLAAALANRRLTWREYETGVIFDPVVQALIDKIELVPDLSLGVFGAVARVELADGRAFESEQDCIAEFPVEEKLYTGADGLLSRRKIAAIVRAVDRLESFGNVRDFVRVANGG